MHDPWSTCVENERGPDCEPWGPRDSWQNLWRRPQSTHTVRAFSCHDLVYLPEAILDELTYRSHRFLGMLSDRFDVQYGTRASTKQKNPHDALGIRGLVLSADRDITSESRSGLHELGCRPSVKPQAVTHHE